jgi:hypothetical protein
MREEGTVLKGPRGVEEPLSKGTVKGGKDDDDELGSLDDSTIDVSSFDKGKEGFLDDSTIVNDTSKSPIKPIALLKCYGDFITEPIPSEWVRSTCEKIRKHISNETVAEILFGKMCYWYPDYSLDDAIQDL